MAKNKDYNRPNRQWECGWAKEGKSCPRGPSPEGACHTKSECEPARQGDRFVCTRLSQRGGKCEQGPNADGTCCLAIPPCIPVRSLRSKRGLLSFYIFAISVGFVLIAFGTSQSANHFFSPGPLSNPHRSIKHDCNTCHGGSQGSIPAQWLVKSSDPHLISKNCQSCHSQGEHPFNSHGMSSEKLQMITKAKLGPDRAKKFEAHLGQQECATCHSEHRGTNTQQEKISNQQCQTCHVNKFSSFSTGHADFKSFPFKRRSRILFDHNAHFSKYFSEKKRENISCNQCHAPEQKGEHMVLRGFEKSCAECHEPATRGVEQLAKGVAFWRLPAMDLKALKGANIGPWPEDAEGKLTPFQLIMLAGDARFSGALKVAGDLDLADLSSATPEQLKNAATLAWGVKVIMQELSREGGSYIKKNIEAALGAPISDAQVASLLGSLPVDLLRATSAAWFKNLDSDVSGWAVKKPRATLPFTIKEADNEKDEAWMEGGGGWYRKSSDFSVRLRPRGHADPFLISWIDLLASTPLNEPVVSKSLNGILDAKVAGTCVKCHSVEQTAEGRTMVSWHGKNRENTSPGFVRFRHSAHFNLLNEKGCITCHTSNSSSEFDKNLEGRDPLVFSSGFMPIKKEACLTCHTGDRVDQSCQSCHNYHVEKDKGHSADFSRIKTKF